MATVSRGEEDDRLGFAVTFLVMGFVVGVLLIPLVGPILPLNRERARERRSASDIRAAAVALEAFAVDHGGLFPPASDGDPSEPLLERPRFECLEPRAWPTRASSGLDELLDLLPPRYIESLPLRDAWGNRLLYATSNDLRSYAIVSMGRDGGLECCYRRSVTRSDDMVYSDGSFRAFPGCGCG